MSMMRELSMANGEMRSMVGQGTPGLNVLLGGGVLEDSSSVGAGAVSSAAYIARAYRDTRVAAVASGGGGGGRPPSFNPINPGPPQIER